MADFIDTLVARVKERRLIASADTQYDDEIEVVILEAQRYISDRLLQFMEIDWEGYAEEDLLTDICCDIATGIFIRRQMPTDMEGATWWGQGIKKLESYIRATFYRGRIIPCWSP